MVYAGTVRIPCDTVLAASLTSDTMPAPRREYMWFMESCVSAGKENEAASTRSWCGSGKRPFIAADQRSRAVASDGESSRPRSPWKKPP